MRGPLAPLRYDAGRAPEGRRLRAGGGHFFDVGSHPRWPQIVFACPDDVNPAARPIPLVGDLSEHGGGDLLG